MRRNPPKIEAPNPLITVRQPRLMLSDRFIYAIETEWSNLPQTMARPTQQDLFGTEDQPELFDAEAAPPAYRPDLEKVRARLQKILTELRAAENLSGDPDKALLYRTVFPHMTGWLPEEEGAQLRFEFDTEMARLKAA